MTSLYFDQIELHFGHATSSCAWLPPASFPLASSLQNQLPRPACANRFPGCSIQARTRHAPTTPRANTTQARHLPIRARGMIHLCELLGCYRELSQRPFHAEQQDLTTATPDFYSDFNQQIEHVLKTNPKHRTNLHHARQHPKN